MKLSNYYIEEVNSSFTEDLDLLWSNIISGIKTNINGYLFQSSKIFLRLENDWDLLYDFDNIVDDIVDEFY